MYFCQQSTITLHAFFPEFTLAAALHPCPVFLQQGIESQCRLEGCNRGLWAP
jgi:hypothetical protein